MSGIPDGDVVRVTLNGRTFEARRGTLLSAFLRERGWGSAPCGGHGRCGKCRVLAEGALSPVSPDERALLTDDELRRGFRLACRARAEGDCRIRAAHPGGADRIRADGSLRPDRLNPAFRRVGAAVDIGTTTLAARLYAPDGALLAEGGRLNPQAAWGADVVSRMEAALAGQAESLRAAVVGAADGLLAELAAKARRPLAADGPIEALVVTGNTVMLHLLTGTSVEPLSHAPFEAARLFGETLTAGALGLSAAPPDAPVYLPPCIAAFIGADTVTALLSSRLTDAPETGILADVGTNGEICLWHGGALSACSTAAGPAFEGAGISMGMGGRDGAVDRVTVQDGRLRAHVLGDGPPVGICGSGLVDAVACLLDVGALDVTGRLSADPAPVAPPVCLTQKDIRMVQLAKSAIGAGIRALLRTAGIEARGVSSLAVAGGFGSSLDARSAGRIGLLPAELVPRVRSVGNAALAGASWLLLDADLQPVARDLVRRARVVDLTVSPVFADEYMEGMLFPEDPGEPPL